MSGKLLKKRQGISDNVFDAINVLLCVVILLIMAYPLYFVVIASFSDPSAVGSGKVWLWPANFSLDGYKHVLEDERVWVGYRNTILYTILGTGFSLLFTLPAAYSLSRRDLPGRNYIMMFFVLPMFFSGGLIPTYLTVNSFGLLDTIWVLVIPFSVSTYNLIIARTFFASTIPQELLEAAMIDGCSNTRFFVSVVVPLSKAIIAVIGLYCAVGQWNQFFTSLVYTRKPELMPLQMALREILLLSSLNAMGISVGTDMFARLRLAELMRYSLIIVATVPVMCFYPFIQKHFTKGVMIGAIKG
jgi:putative aldouronate transport system permease protein